LLIFKSLYIFLKKEVQTMTQYRNEGAADLFLDLIDSSVLTLVEFIANDGQIPNEWCSKASKSGWDLPVSHKALKAYADVSSTDCHPFVVGGVGTNTGEGYRQLLLLKAARKAWAELATNKIHSSNFIEIAEEVLAETETITLPDKSESDIIKKALPTLIEHAKHAQPIFESTEPFLPDGMPGCLRDNYLIDGQKMLADLVGTNLIQALDTLETNEDSVPQIDCLNDAYSWYVEAMKAKEVKCVFGDAAESAIAGIAALLEAASRTNVSGVLASTAAAEKIALWRNL